MFFLATQGLAVWSFVRSSGSESSALTAALAGALAIVLFILRPDLSIYPTTQGFALGALFFVGWLWRGPCPSVALRTLSLGAALVVVMGHGLTGAAAVAFVGARSAQSVLAKDTRRSGALFLVASAGLGLAFLVVNRLPYPGTSHAVTWSSMSHGVWAFLDGWQLLVLIISCAALAWRAGGLVPIALLALGLLFGIGAELRADPSEVDFFRVNADRFVFFSCVTLALALWVPAAAAWLWCLCSSWECLRGGEVRLRRLGSISLGSQPVTPGVSNHGFCNSFKRFARRRPPTRASSPMLP